MKLLPILAAAAAATLAIPAASAAAAPAAPAVAAQPDFQHHRPHHVRKRSYYRSVCKTGVAPWSPPAGVPPGALLSLIERGRERAPRSRPCLTA